LLDRSLSLVRGFFRVDGGFGARRNQNSLAIHHDDQAGSGPQSFTFGAQSGAAKGGHGSNFVSARAILRAAHEFFPLSSKTGCAPALS
jgi:hypothetical protein